MHGGTTTNKQNSADRAQGLRYFAYFRPLCFFEENGHSVQNIIKNEHNPIGCPYNPFRNNRCS